MQMQQQSSILVSIAKSVQLNSEELKECKEKVQKMEKQMEELIKENDDMKERLPECQSGSGGTSGKSCTRPGRSDGGRGGWCSRSWPSDGEQGPEDHRDIHEMHSER